MADDIVDVIGVLLLNRRSCMFVSNYQQLLGLCSSVQDEDSLEVLKGSVIFVDAKLQEDRRTKTAILLKYLVGVSRHLNLSFIFVTDSLQHITEETKRNLTGTLKLLYTPFGVV
jgi:hypothetical protein